MKKIVSVLLVFFVLLSVSTGMVFADEATEQNIPSEWAMDSIMNSYESGLLDADKEYSYKTPISREDFCELIYSFILKTDFLTKESVKIEEKSFADTSNEKVLDLAGLGIINGKSQNLFAPLDNLTREEAATIIIRTINTVSPMPTTEMWFEYEDIKSISGWALNSVQTISNMGIMKGVGNNRFQPKGRYTTEQAITVIWRLYELCKEHEPTEEPEKKEKERITIPVSAKINDDLSVEWDLPDEYDFLRGNDYLSSVYFVSKDGEERSFFGSTQCVTEISGEKIAECLVKDLDTKWKTIHYRRYSNEKEYIIEINLPDIKTVIEGEAVTPGRYINKKKSWVLVELTLGGEEKFEPGCYYLLKSYETLYREEEYNKKDYKCFSVDEVSDVFYAPTNQSFGALFPDNVHIQKVTVSGNAKAGFVLSLTPESESIFERVEKSGY